MYAIDAITVRVHRSYVFIQNARLQLEFKIQNILAILIPLCIWWPRDPLEYPPELTLLVIRWVSRFRQRVQHLRRARNMNPIGQLSAAKHV